MWLASRRSVRDPVLKGGGATFFHNGTNGRWREVLTAQEVAAFEAESARGLPAGADAWANRKDAHA